MIAPSARLLWCVALLVVPLCTLAGVAPALAAPCALAVAALTGVSIADALRARRSLAQVKVSAPPALRWFKDRAVGLPLEVRNAVRHLRVHLDLPREISAEPGTLDAPPFEFRCTPRERGQFTLVRCHLEILSPLSFWYIAAERSLATEIRVYPDLQREHGVNLLLARRTEGLHNQRQVGKGREFEKLRDYMHGDSFEDIHWKASARRGRPVVKVFQIEHTQEIYVVVDASRLSARAGILERYVNAALMLALAAEAQSDKFGLVAFGDRVDRFVRAGAGKRHFAACRDAIYTVQPRPVSPDFQELFTMLQLQLRRRSLLLFLTSLDDPLLAESFARDVRILARRHLVMVDVPRQEEVRPLFSGPPAESVDAVYEDLAGHLQWTKLRELQKTLEREGVTMAVLDPQQLGLQLARQYLQVKQRQRL